MAIFWKYNNQLVHAFFTLQKHTRIKNQSRKNDSCSKIRSKKLCD